MSVSQNKTQCLEGDGKSQSLTPAAIAAAVGGTVAAGGLLYWGFVMESADKKRVPLTPEELEKYLDMLRNTGNSNPTSELNHIRQQFGKVRTAPLPYR